MPRQRPVVRKDTVVPNGSPFVFFFIWLTLSNEMPMDTRRWKLSTTPSGVRAMLPVELRRPPEVEERTLPKDERAPMLSSSISVSDRSGVYMNRGHTRCACVACAAPAGQSKIAFSWREAFKNGRDKFAAKELNAICDTVG